MTKKIRTKKLLIIAVYLILFSLSHSNTWAENATLSWYPTTTNANGAPLTNLSGYKVYYGIVSSTYTQVVNVGLTGNPAAPAHAFTNLAAGNTYYFAVTAYDTFGNESKFSNEVSKTFTSTPTTTTRPSTITTTSTTTTTTIPNSAPKADALTPSIVTTAPGVTQTFTAAYSDPDGWQNLTEVAFYISGGGHDQWLHYIPAANNFTLVGANSNCKPGQPAKLLTNFLTLNCSASKGSGLGTRLTVTFSLTSQPPFSGAQYRLFIVAYDKGGRANAKLVGNWTIQSQGPG